MTNFTRAGLAGLLALALASSALAQTTAPVAPAAGAPTATEPAATETPKTPAAAGGDASDATASGQPAGSAAASDASGTAPASEAAAPATGTAAPAGGAAPEKTFPIPRAGDTAQQVELITGLCGVQMKDMKPESCKCLAEQSLTNLSDPQRDYLIATVVSPPAADRMLADGRVGQPDQQVISSFIDKTSDACATGTYTPAK